MRSKKLNFRKKNGLIVLFTPEIYVISGFRPYKSLSLPIKTH